MEETQEKKQEKKPEVTEKDNDGVVGMGSTFRNSDEMRKHWQNLYL